MINEVLSVGIDIGTTTTQIIFSKICLQNTARTFLIPEVKITHKKIIYKSKIYFTPLINREKIDLEAVKEIVCSEYEKASIDIDDISTGAIIITGETARKKNAEKAAKILSDFAGDFVVATAGPDLEAILAGFGAGAAAASKDTTAKVINYDIGGGTTNASVFFDGEVTDSFALDIGGRLISFDEFGTITYISDKILNLIEKLEINLRVGAVPKFEDLKLLTEILADVLCRINDNDRLSMDLERLFIGHKNKLCEAAMVMFSGGVSEFIYSDIEINTLEATIIFHDIGPLLGYSIRKAFEKKSYKILEPVEKIRATVIGAGSYSLKISGTTIVYSDDILPLKNVPIIKISNSTENPHTLYEAISSTINLYKDSLCAVAFKGPKAPSYLEIKNMAMAIIEAFKNSKNPIIVIVENDFAKALGQTITNILRNSKGVICLDRIKVDNGDYVDIGRSIASIVPVVVKTLIFTS